MLINETKYHRPTSINEAAELYSSLKSVKLLAGGTFVVNTLKAAKNAGRKTSANIISLKNIADFNTITYTAKELTINAMATITDIRNSQDIPENLSVLKEVSANIGTTQIRNMATIGGNIACRYTWTEFPAVLVALDAILVFTDQDNKTESLSAEEFFANGAKTKSILTSIKIQDNSNTFSSYQRFTKSSSIDIPLGALCITADIENKTISNTKAVLNTTKAFPQRDENLEKYLNGKSINSDLAIEAVKHMNQSLLDSLNNEYQKHMFEISVKNSIIDIADKI